MDSTLHPAQDIILRLLLVKKKRYYPVRFSIAIADALLLVLFSKALGGSDALDSSGILEIMQVKPSLLAVKIPSTRINSCPGMERSDSSLP